MAGGWLQVSLGLGVGVWDCGKAIGGTQIPSNSACSVLGPLKSLSAAVRVWFLRRAVG